MSNLRINAEHIKAANPPQFAKLIGVTTSSVYRYFEGADPSIRHLKQASIRLNIPFAELFELFGNWIEQEKKRRLLQKEIESYFKSLASIEVA